ncbi:hypothetical protein CMMCAS02_01255 [Clavibacter michiganensis subsp. michiganensis]|nr:hypothetical protein CMMCAS02_01255 [Clavibacter michiganensis subsp. michiganensis]OUD86119.1 hypothetical protein CMMCAS03_13805 [Clavibacter michiganensis subsp. michiganensis]SLJ86612.1 hypothetical protein SAMN06265879_0073 [Clavibacter michiganensis]
MGARRWPDDPGTVLGTRRPRQSPDGGCGHRPRRPRSSADAHDVHDGAARHRLRAGRHELRRTSASMGPRGGTHRRADPEVPRRTGRRPPRRRWWDHGLRSRGAGRTRPIGRCPLPRRRPGRDHPPPDAAGRDPLESRSSRDHGRRHHAAPRRHRHPRSARDATRRCGREHHRDRTPSCADCGGPDPARRHVCAPGGRGPFGLRAAAPGLHRASARCTPHLGQAGASGAQIPVIRQIAVARARPPAFAPRRPRAGGPSPAGSPRARCRPPRPPAPRRSGPPRARPAGSAPRASGRPRRA